MRVTSLVLLLCCGLVAVTARPEVVRLSLTDPKVVVTVEESSSGSHSSSSSSSSSSKDRKESETKSWESTEVNTADKKVSVNKLDSRREESGRDSDSKSKAENSGSHKLFKKTNSVNGETLTDTERGTKKSYKESSESSSNSEFANTETKSISKVVVNDFKYTQCLKGRRLTVFVVLQFNEGWQQKVRFLQSLVQATLDEKNVNYYIIGDKIGGSIILSTFGTSSLTKEQLLMELVKLEAKKMRQTNAFSLSVPLTFAHTMAGIYMNEPGVKDSALMLMTLVNNKDLEDGKGSIPQLKNFFELMESRSPFILRCSVGDSATLKKQKPSIADVLASASKFSGVDMSPPEVGNIMVVAAQRYCRRQALG